MEEMVSCMTDIVVYSVTLVVTRNARMFTEIKE